MVQKRGGAEVEMGEELKWRQRGVDQAQKGSKYGR